MASRNKTNDFLRAMNPEVSLDMPETTAAVPAPLIAAPVPIVKARAAKQKTTSRANLKHFGGYISEETDEKIAVMRARLKLDNSELIKLAIDDLHRKHSAKRAFGDE